MIYCIADIHQNINTFNKLYLNKKQFIRGVRTNYTHYMDYTKKKPAYVCNVCYRVYKHDGSMIEGNWTQSPDYAYVTLYYLCI